MFDIVNMYVHIEYFSLIISFLDMNMNSIPIHMIQGMVTIKSIKIPNREKNPITIVIQRKCNGISSHRVSKACGKWETIPTNLFGGDYTNYMVL